MATLARSVSRDLQTALTDEQWGALSEEEPRPEVADARVRGYATSHDEVVPGLASVAVPLSVPGQPAAAVAVVYVAGGGDVEAIAQRLLRVASAIVAELR